METQQFDQQSIQPTSWLQELKEVENKPLWLKEGERIEIKFGAWKKVVEIKKNGRTGEEFRSIHYTLEGTQGETKVYRNVAEKLWMDICRKFLKEYPQAKNQSMTEYEETLKKQMIVYRRPMTA